MRVIVAQKGAREHYAVARALHERGLLAGLVTDWYATARVRWLASLAGKRGRAALAARCEAIPDDLVYSFPVGAFLWKQRVRRLAAQGRIYDGFDETDRAFAQAVARRKLPSHTAYFGYSYASLEYMELAKERGVFTILDQIDPGPVEHRMVEEERARFPELAGSPEPYPEEHFERARREWELADVILVNSTWSRDAILSEGAPTDKIEVIPLCYQSSIRDKQPEKRARAGLRLRVLFLGQVNVRKGIRYLVEAARMLEQEAVEFIVAGPIQIGREYVSGAPGNIKWLGPVARDEAAELYEDADIFILPTLSDGFAITQLEALAYGLPVITTLNCGRVVDDGKTGYIVPARDGAALAERILRFVKNRELAAAMGPNCLEAVRRYSLEEYGAKLTAIIEKHQAEPARSFKISLPVG